MICPKCKTEITDDTALFCEVCGEPLDRDSEKVNEQAEVQPIKKGGFFALEERNNPLPWWRYLVAIGVYFFLMEFGAAVFQILLTSIYQNTTGQTAIIDGKLTAEAAQFVSIRMQILTYAAVTLATALLLWKPMFSDIKYSSHRVGKVFAFIGIGIASMYAANILISILFTIIELFAGKGFLTGDSQNQQAIEDMISTSSPGLFAIYAVVLVICAPLVEELIFRKSLCSLFGKFKRVWRIVFSAVLFGSMHVLPAMLGYAISGLWELLLKEFILGFQYIAMGAVLAGIYEYSNKNLVVSFAAHAANNFISVVTMYFMMNL